MIHTATNVIGGGDGWACNADGTIQVKTLATGDTSVAFTNVPVNEFYGYDLWIDMDNATSLTANTPVVTTEGKPTFVVGTDGKYTVTFNFSSAIRADQAGTTCQCRIVR